MSSFPYSKLQPGEFRILELLRGPVAAPIRGVLKTKLIELEDSSDYYGYYEALSYVWRQEPLDPNKAERPPDHILLCLDGQTKLVKFPVTWNLAMALRYLRESDDDRTLWIDAICVNQEDDIEKGQQVPQMRAIYGQAK